MGSYSTHLYHTGLTDKEKRNQIEKEFPVLSIAWMCRRRLWFVRLYFGTPVTQSGSCRWVSASRTNVNRYHLCVYVCSLWDMYSPAKRETGAAWWRWWVNHKGTRAIKSWAILQVSGYRIHLTRSAPSGCYTIPEATYIERTHSMHIGSYEKEFSRVWMPYLSLLMYPATSKKTFFSFSLSGVAPTAAANDCMYIELGCIRWA